MVALWQGFAMTEPITITGVAHVADERATVVVVGRADEYRQRAEMAAAFGDAMRGSPSPIWGGLAAVGGEG